MNERLERLRVLAAIAALMGLAERSGFIPRGPGTNPYADSVPFSEMWWHVPLVWLLLSVAFVALEWLGNASNEGWSEC
jgi:hypothetical protein